MKNKQLPLVTFTQAKRLDKTGFDWDTLSRYDYSCGMITETNTSRNHNDKNKWTNKDKQGCSAPTVALALKWMRDVKGLKFAVGYNVLDGDYRWWSADIINPESNVPYTYENQESALLDELLTLIEK